MSAPDSNTTTNNTASSGGSTAGKSYIGTSINALAPWSSRSATPTNPDQAQEGEGQGQGESSLGPQRGGDHAVSRRLKLSFKSYPPDCPPLNVQWFHAVDVPKRKPIAQGRQSADSSKLPPAPKKYSPFSASDSRAIEAAFQKLAEDEEASRRELDSVKRSSMHSAHNTEEKRTGASIGDGDNPPVSVKVPVHEDYLFDVDVEERELSPAYWLGPVYDVRRGTWFFSESSGLRPCDENLATQLEEGYLKTKPWRFGPQFQHQRSASQPRARPLPKKEEKEQGAVAKSSSSTPVTPKSSSSNLKAELQAQSPSVELGGNEEASPKDPQQRTHRLFGAHMNSVVTYQDASTAWLLTDDFLSRMSSTMYERFAGGGHFAGVKLVRGYTEPSKKGEAKDAKVAPTTLAEAEKKSPKSGTGKMGDDSKKANQEDGQSGAKKSEEAPAISQSQLRRRNLERQMSSLVESAAPENPEEQEEEARRREEKEIQDDYKDQQDEQGRPVEHVLLVTHGIGQRLGLRMDSVNFVHDVNTLRKTLKAVYANSPDLQALNSEVEQMPKNSRVQVLPICWRHLLDFPKQSLKYNRTEHDLGDAGFGEEEDYPNLESITVEGVPAVRNLITDLALDILLYQSPAYKDHISQIVVRECNRIYKLFKERNPSFDGKISFLGHSLGSAIMFDILCRQGEGSPQENRHQGRGSDKDVFALEFEVEDFYAIGSPLGLFQMLKGRTIAARKNSRNAISAKTPMAALDDPFVNTSSLNSSEGSRGNTSFQIATSYPKCAQIYNIFHPTDPISYRIEPLISPAMASLKPQPLPYTKKGIFDAPVGHGLTGIGARVGQSVSGLWTSFSSGIASSLLNRSLGISADDAQKLATQQGPPPVQHPGVPLAQGAGTNLAGGVLSPDSMIPATAKVASAEKKSELAAHARDAKEEGEHPPTLIDTEIETLYAGFQKRRKSHQSDADLRDLGESPAWQETEERARKLQREEAKVRALNSNGRVDYSIQEGVFDISLIASIASHLSYWADEDVSHFIISQLLARQHRRSSSAEEARI